MRSYGDDRPAGHTAVNIAHTTTPKPEAVVAHTVIPKPEAVDAAKGTLAVWGEKLPTYDDAKSQLDALIAAEPVEPMPAWLTRTRKEN